MVGCPGPRKGGNREVLFNWYRVSVLQDERSYGDDNGDSCSTM